MRILTVKKVYPMLEIRDWSKFTEYPGSDHRQGDEDFFSTKKGEDVFFSKTFRGLRRFLSRKIGGRILLFFGKAEGGPKTLLGLKKGAKTFSDQFFPTRHLVNFDGSLCISPFIFES